MSGRPQKFDPNFVIEAAMKAFWDKGFEGTSTQELCDKTGMGRGSLYHSFESKSHLYEQALLRYHELGIKEQTRILLADDSAINRLQALLEWGTNCDTSSESRRCCMAIYSAIERSGKDSKVDKINRHYFNKLESLISSVIEQGMTNNELRNDRSTLEATRGFIASYYGLRILGVLNPSKEFLSTVISSIIENL
ncbi:TetR/AcrR family transcriptional regulator [Tatumella sp. OPLPL6]|uniref:TetR/AcrR family transcriptional regulator n=1 Tax=Tatumella sp. OPLPL6 TaxID=1928657 RepID=UPI000C17D442|nr:TetR/AcrR family transcriptional regulator [Tatumella sp. OPLPL6]PIJ46995.1 TetR family transcriptional regulator [Tatumella sp. OPLPL6]